MWEEQVTNDTILQDSKLSATALLSEVDRVTAVIHLPCFGLHYYTFLLSMDEKRVLLLAATNVVWQTLIQLVLHTQIGQIG